MAFTTTALVVTTAVSAAVSMAGQYMQGQQQKKSLNYQKKVAEQQAVREREIALQKAADFRRDQSGKMAHRRATVAGRGGAGRSEGYVIEDFTGDSEYKASLIRDQGFAEASRLDNQANLLGYSAKNAATNSYWNMAGTAARSGAKLAKGIGPSSMPDVSSAPGNTYGGGGDWGMWNNG